MTHRLARDFFFLVAVSLLLNYFSSRALLIGINP